MIRVGVVGAGNHSRRNHGPALRRYCADRPNDVDLRAVCDLDPDRATEYAETFGLETTYEDLDAMLGEESLDAVVAVTPVEATHEIASKLLSRGTPVLIEKPPGRTLDEARDLEAVAARHETPHAVSFNRRFNPAVQRAREWIAESAPSQPTHALARLLRSARFEDGFVPKTGIHAVDAVCSVLGRPTSVTARRGHGDAGSAGVGCRCVARVAFPDASAQFTIDSDAGRRAETYELFGRGYSVRIDVEAARFDAWVDDETVASWQVSGDAPPYERNGTLGETRAFLDAVRGEGAFSPSLSDAVASFELARAMGEGRDGELGRSDPGQ